MHAIDHKFVLHYFSCISLINNGMVTRVIISMTKLLHADWLRGVQLFH